MALLAGGLAGWMGYVSSRTALREAAFEHLTSLRESRARCVEGWFSTLRRVVGTLAEAPLTRTALADFDAAVDEGLAGQATDVRAALEAWYERDLAPRFDASLVAGGRPPVPDDPVTLVLQHDYLAANPHPIGAKDELVAGARDTAYDRAHAKHHPVLKRISQRFGLYDLFVVDAATRRVVYTVFKECDFGVRLDTGAWPQTGLARVVEAALADPAAGVHVEDYSSYVPSHGAPAAFLAHVLPGPTGPAGVLVAQMPVDELDRIMTAARLWSDEGLGSSGETYLVGPDRRMRSISRFLVEERDRYLAQLRALGTPDDVVRRIAAYGTSILQQSVDTEGSREALAGSRGTRVIKDYRGVDVLSSYRPLDVPGLRWALLAEIDAEEAFAPVTALRNRLLAFGLGLLALVALTAWWAARGLARPVERVREAAGALAQGELGARVGLHRNDEIGDLANSFDQMAERIEADQREIRARHQENEALLLNILPRPIATRLKQGEGQIADAFPQVGILFADLVEFTKLSSVTHPTELVALLNELFTEFDELMTRRGIEKIKTIGDCYMAVCGVPEPAQEPAHAMAEAALALQKSLARFNDRTGRSFQLRIGLNCGPVVAGVIGSSKFIYDLWGDTVNMASRMESTGQPGTIQLTEAMAEAIRDRFDVELRGTFDIKGKGPTAVWILRGARSPRSSVS